MCYFRAAKIVLFIKVSLFLRVLISSTVDSILASQPSIYSVATHSFPVPHVPGRERSILTRQ